VPYVEVELEMKTKAKWINITVRTANICVYHLHYCRIQHSTEQFW